MSIISVTGLFDMLLNVVSHVLKGLRDIAASIVGRVLSTFGLTMVSFQSIMPDIKAYLISVVGGLPGNIVSLLSAMGVDVAMTLILSALSVRLAWKVFIIPKSVAQNLGVGS